MGGLAPGQLKSRRGSHSSPRRLHYRLSFFDRVFKNSLRGKTLSILWEWRILIAIDLRQPGPLWSAKLAQSYAAADSEELIASAAGSAGGAGVAGMLWSRDSEEVTTDDVATLVPVGELKPRL